MVESEKDMTPVLLEDLGMRFTSDTEKYRKRYGLYQCQYCGKEWKTQMYNIKSGNTKSCGCQSPAHSNQHGLSNHPLRTAWRSMYQRCYNQNNPKYKNYGARGIIVCDEWKNNLINFYNWAIENRWVENSGVSLDRIDVNGNYEPDNCRWTDANTQMQNTQNVRSNNKSGFRGVYFCKRSNRYVAGIRINNKYAPLGYYKTALEAGKAYERYVRIHNLEHNFTPALTEEEVALL